MHAQTVFPTNALLLKTKLLLTHVSQYRINDNEVMSGQLTFSYTTVIAFGMRMRGNFF